MNSPFTQQALSLAIVAAISGGISTAAYGQNEEPEKIQLEEMEVVGMKANLKSAQELKRNADTVKDVITSSDIGALPDKSVTEALMRVPGVTIERFASSNDPNHFAAEGTGVVIRGLKRVRSEINGRDSFSARRDGGGLNFEDIPPELLGSVEVVKNTTADLISGGVAGTVNLVTRKPFDSDDQVIFGSIKGSYGDHREEWTPSFSGVFSDSWETSAGKFGFLIAGSKSEFKDRGDGVAMDNYYERSATADEMPQFGVFGTELADYPGQTLYTPAGAVLRTSDSERNRTGLASSVQWLSPDDRLEVTAEYISSNANLSWDERTLQYGEQGFNVNPNTSDVSGANFDSRGFMTDGTLLMGTRSVAQTRWRETETDIEDLSLHFTYNATENLTLDADIQRIESTFEANDYTMSNSFLNDDVYFNTSGDRPSVMFLGDNLNAPTTHNEMTIASAMDKEDDHEAEATSVAFDIKYEFDQGFIRAIKGGGYFSEKEQTIRDSYWNWGEVSATWASYENGGFSANPLDHPEIFESVTFDSSNFHGGGVLPQDLSVLFPKSDNVHNWQGYHANTSVDNGGFSTFVPLRERCKNQDPAECKLDGAFFPFEISSTEEERREFYLQMDYAFDELDMPIKGNVGLRHLSWDVSSTGSTQFPVPVPGWRSDAPYYTDDQLAYQNGYGSDPETVDGGNFSTVLPSFNISLSVTDDQILRFAASKNVYFPDFSDLRQFRLVTQSRQDIIDENGTQIGIDNVNFDGETGNPYVDPESANSYDLTYEWYFADAGSLTGSLFRKDLDNVIHERLYVEDVTNPESNVTFPVSFSQQTNDGSGTLQGFEVAYQQFYDFLPGAWSGLGTQLNYTFVEQDGINDEMGFGGGVAGNGGRNNFRAFEGLDLPGYSEDTVNVALMYEYADISARMAYNWRSEYLLTRRDADLFAPVIADDTGQLDASISYQINDNFKIGVEANNLLNEIISTQMIYNQEGEQTPRSYFKTDTRYAVYLQANF